MSEQDPGFSDLINGLEPDGKTFKAKIPDAWRQGRTAYGGVTSGLSYAAARQAFSDLPPLRSFQTTFVGPVGAQSTLKPSVLRTGKNVTCVNVDVLTEDNVVGRTIFIFGRERVSSFNDTRPAPTAQKPEDTEEFTPPQFRPFVPAFFLRFETKLIDGGRPMTGTDKTHIRAWARHNDPAMHDDMAGFICLGDVLPPAVAPTLKPGARISSINWQMNIVAPGMKTRDGWWHVETRQTAGHSGYSSQIMRFWNTDGDMIAEGTQTVAIFT